MKSSSGLVASDINADVITDSHNSIAKDQRPKILFLMMG